jgi:hypothetical protein
MNNPRQIAQLLIILLLGLILPSEADNDYYSIADAISEYFGLTTLCSKKISRQNVEWEKIREAFKAYCASPSADSANKILSIMPKKFDNSTTNFDEWASTVDSIYRGEPFKVLKDLVRKGDEFAILVAFSTLVISDGAFAEELSDLIGESLGVNPTAFLEGAKILIENPQATSVFLKEILAGGFYADSDTVFKQKMQMRIKLLETITRPDLLNIRDICVKEMSRWKQTFAGGWHHEHLSCWE